MQTKGRHNIQKCVDFDISQIVHHGL